MLHLCRAVPMLVVLPPAVVKDEPFAFVCVSVLVVAFRSRASLSDADKKAILEVYHKGEESFGGVNEEDRR